MILSKNSGRWWHLNLSCIHHSQLHVVEEPIPATFLLPRIYSGGQGSPRKLLHSSSQLPSPVSERASLGEKLPLFRGAHPPQPKLLLYRETLSRATNDDQSTPSPQLLLVKVGLSKRVKTCSSAALPDVAHLGNKE